MTRGGGELRRSIGPPRLRLFEGQQAVQEVRDPREVDGAREAGHEDLDARLHEAGRVRRDGVEQLCDLRTKEDARPRGLPHRGGLVDRRVRELAQRLQHRRVRLVRGEGRGASD